MAVCGQFVEGDRIKYTGILHLQRRGMWFAFNSVLSFLQFGFWWQSVFDLEEKMGIFFLTVLELVPNSTSR